MGSVKLVTGFVPIPNHPRSAEEYQALGRQWTEPLAIEGYSIHKGVCPVEKTALRPYVNAMTTWKVGDNPAKNTMEYHLAQHQKMMFIYEAYQNTPVHPDAYVWIDLGIMHIPGMSVDVIRNYANRVEAGDTIDIPGCWSKEEAELILETDYPVWRFCGGLIKVPSSLVPKFCVQTIVGAAAWLKLSNKLEWEVNTLARLEQLDILPLRWYKADHDATMFTGAP